MMRYSIIMLLALFLISCSSSDNAHAIGEGGSTETVGFVISSTGDPAPDVLVQFVPADYVPDDKGTQFETRTSNSDGIYSYTGINSGTYNLMYKKGGEVAFRESLTVVNGTIKKKVIDTLSLFGSLAGVVRLHEKHNSDSVFIIIRGTNRFLAPLDSTGRFLIDSLAEGEYMVTFMADYDDYAKFDTTVMITSGFADTLDDTIRLEYEGIGIPLITATEYDSSLLHATIKWNAIDSDNLKGYQITRKTCTPDSAIQETFFQTDTFFVDSCNNGTVIEGEKYLYQITSVNNGGMSSKWSKAASITYHSLFSKKDSLKLTKSEDASFISMDCSKSGMLYLVRSSEPLLHKINSETMTYVASYPLPDTGFPTDISLVNDSTLFVATNKGVYEIDTLGIRQWWYKALSWENDKGTGGRFTAQVSSLDSTSFYYTASMGLFATPNTIMRFNCKGGKRDTLVALSKGSIESFYIDTKSEQIYILIKQYNRLSLEQSSLHQYRPTTLYECDYSSDAQLCPCDDMSLTLLQNRRLLTLVTENKPHVKNQMFFKDDYLAVVSLKTGERVAYRKDGAIIKIGKKN